MTMTYGSVCSGIEAATVAWQGLGWKPSWFSEIEPFPSAVLAHHYPDVPNTGDMLALPRKILAGEVRAPDILCGGTPCQGFSVAGLRGSLDDDRSNLSLTFCEIANAIDQIRHLRGEQPSIIFWENVPGVLNTKDNAFGCLLGELAGETCELQPPGGASKWANAGCVFGPQRTVAWRVFDAQYFGVAQRRRRVFVVASARTRFDPAEILFELDGLRRDTAPSRKAGQEVAATTGGGAEGRRGSALSHWDNLDNPHPTLCQSHNTGGIGLSNQEIFSQGGGGLEQNGFRMTAFGEYADDETASTMKARDYKDATDLVAFNSRQDPVSGDVFGSLDTCSPQAQAIVYPFNSMTMLGRPSDDLKPRMGLGVGGPDDPQNTLTGNHHHAVAIAYGCTPTKLNDVVNTITASYGQGGVDLETKPLAIVTAIADDVTPKTSEEIGFTLSATDFKCPQAVAIAWDEELNARQELAGTLLRGGQGGRHDGVMVPAYEMQVRRLTPVECERLQGFPEIVKTCTITVLQHSNSNVCFSDLQSTNALAAHQYHKSPSNASPAEEDVFPSNANAAELNLNADQGRSSAPVLVNVRIDLERQHLQLHSQGKLLLSASIADASEWCRLPIQIEDFVQMSVAMLSGLEKKTPRGRAGSRPNTRGSFPRLIGKWSVNQSGQEIEELASDAGKFTIAVKNCMKSITSEVGRNSQNCGSNLQTLLCCVTTAISSFIPSEIRSASSYALGIEVSHGYTQIPWAGKPADQCPDGHRYKALGNSWAVPVVRWIGSRIDAAVNLHTSGNNSKMSPTYVEGL